MRETQMTTEENTTSKKRGTYNKGLDTVVSARKVGGERSGVLVLFNSTQCKALGIQPGSKVSVDVQKGCAVVTPRTEP